MSTQVDNGAADEHGGAADHRQMIPHQDEFYAEFDVDIADDASDDEIGGVTTRAPGRGSWQCPATAASPHESTRLSLRPLRRAAAPMILASALAIGALAHGAVADMIRTTVPGAGGSALVMPQLPGGAWRRLPSLDAGFAAHDATPKAIAAPADEGPPANIVDAAREAPVDTATPLVPGDSVAPVSRDVQSQAEARFLPMAFDAICALPIVRAAFISTPEPAVVSPIIPGTPTQTITTGSPAPLDIHIVAVEWPMLEPWSRRPDEPVPYVASVRAKAMKTSIRSGVVAAAKPLPTPVPEPEPQPETVSPPKPRPKSAAMAAGATPATSQPPVANTTRTFEAVAKDSP